MARLAVRIRGVVQGVGFRPFVFNLAKALQLGGFVRNESDEVRIEAVGARAALEDFLQRLRRDAPPQARIDELTCEWSPAADQSCATAAAGSGAVFAILPSAAGSSPRPVIPADLATCAACRDEIRSPNERRFRYPFTNCTNCGPRWSIIEQVPYDRPRTSMAAFTMCAACRAEYENPADRRFHAQPIACPQCGPRLQLVFGNGTTLAEGDAALTEAGRRLARGEIVALKGIGGFQLLVDATDETAVARLRERKRRPHRPLAVMIASAAEGDRHCELAREERAILQSPQAPIMLLRRRAAAGTPRGDDALAVTGISEAAIAPSVAPDNPLLGVMLPCTPLHHLLLDEVRRPLVCTSGNLAEEPMATTLDDARQRLAAVADVFLTHDRPIVRPVDDSVARFGPRGLELLRRARGYAPLPIALPPANCNVDAALPKILALGGHLKNTVAINVGRQAVLSAHVGDLESAASVAVFRRAVDDLLTFFQFAPSALTCDLHPDYASTREAEAWAERLRVPLVRVQHHHAHAAAVMAEHRLEGPLLAFSFDGTGYGPDGTIWGGECLVCEGAEYRRAAHLRTFPLPGGDRAAREPRRSALGALYEIMGDMAAVHARAWFAPAELAMLMSALARPRLCPRTSSLGRLFDAIAALCGLGTHASFEGQAAMALEFAADASIAESYPLPLTPSTVLPAAAHAAAVLKTPVEVRSASMVADAPLVADWGPLLLAVLEDLALGVTVAQVSAKFHNALADLAVQVAEKVGLPQVVLGGGCFQNALLSRLVRERLTKAGFLVEWNRAVPPGDGGIALGQLWVTMQQLTRGDARVA